MEQQLLIMVTGLEAYSVARFLSVYRQYKEGITRPLSVDEIHSYELDYEFSGSSTTFRRIGKRTRLFTAVCM